MHEATIDCSLKHYCQMFLSFAIKDLPNLNGACLFEYMEINGLCNKDIEYDNIENRLPNYYNNPEEDVPSPGEFRQWPLKISNDLKMVHVPPNPKMMQPKSNKVEETVNVFFVSPRMIIRNGKYWGKEFTYADTFFTENKITIMEFVDNGQLKIRFKNEFRINIIKKVMLIGGIIVSETEGQLRHMY